MIKEFLNTVGEQNAKVASKAEAVPAPKAVPPKKAPPSKTGSSPASGASSPKAPADQVVKKAAVAMTVIPGTMARG